jgi:hypothetical protein
MNGRVRPLEIYRGESSLSGCDPAAAYRGPAERRFAHCFRVHGAPCCMMLQRLFNAPSSTAMSA